MRVVSFYGSPVSVRLKPYTGIDYSKVAFIFPGQGSLQPEFLSSLIKKEPALLKYFEVADQICDEAHRIKPSQILFDQKKVSSRDLAFARNIVLFCLEVGLYDLLSGRGVHPAVLTGHSFGEYAVWVAAGAMDFKDMLHIVIQRELKSPDVNEQGTLVALSASADDFLNLNCDVDCVIANINSKKQIVLAVDNQNLKKLNSFLRKNRIASRVLEAVGRPYHSRFMTEVQQHIKDYISKTHIVLSPLKNNVISSVNQRYYKKGDLLSLPEILEILSQQLTEPVHFVNQIQQVESLQIYSYLELGTSGIYLDFIRGLDSPHKRYLKKINDYLESSSELSSIREKSVYNIDPKDNFVFKRTSEFISKMTGYEAGDLTLYDNLQEDLRIDSIKKAEIIFRVLEDSRVQINNRINFSQMERVGDIVQFIESIITNKKNVDSKIKLKETWTCYKLGYHDQRQPIYLESYSTEKSYYNLDMSQVDQGLVSFLNQQTDLEKILVMKLTKNLIPTDKMIYDFIFRLKSILDIIPEGQIQSLWFITDTESDITYGVKGFLKSWAKESGCQFRSLNTGDQAFDLDQIKCLLQKNNFTYDLKLLPQVAHRDFVMYGLDEKPAASPMNIIVLGGARGLAFEILSRMSKKFSGLNLILVGRSSAEEDEIRKNLTQLKKRFKGVEYISVDASEVGELQKVIDHAKAKFKTVDCIVNSIGIEKSRLLKDKNREEIILELNSKVKVTQNLKKQGIKTIHFSSIVGEFGNEGQTIYGFGNGYQIQDNENITLLWPAIARVGMTKNLGILQKLKSAGISLLDPKEAVRFFENILTHFSTTSGTLLYSTEKDLLLLKWHFFQGYGFPQTLGHLSQFNPLEFSRVFDHRKENYLLDHHIGTALVVPGCVAMAMALYFSMAYWNRKTDLLHFELKNVLIVGESTVEAHVRFIFEKENKIHFLMSAIVENFVGQLQVSTESNQNQNRVPQKYVKKADMTQFYSINVVDYGLKFQVLEHIFFNDQKDVLGIGVSIAPYYTGQNLFDRLCFMIEIGFQTICVASFLRNTGLVIPIKIRKTTVHSFEFTTVYAVPEVLPSEPRHEANQIYAHVRLYNEKHECLLEMYDVQMTSIRAYEELPFAVYDHETTV